MTDVFLNPWTRAGVTVRGARSAQEALVASGQAWRATKEPLYLKSGDLVEEAVVVVRDSDQHQLGVVGPDYEVYNNDEAFAWADGLLGAGVRYESAGCLGGGRRTWILARMPETVEPIPGDPTIVYLLIANSFDGSLSLGGHITPIRVACENFLRMGIREAERSFTVRHTRNMREGMEEATRALQIVSRYTALFEEAMRGLAARAVTWPLTETFIDRMIPLPAEEGRGHTLAERGREKLLELVEAGKGANIPGVRGTAYGLYNAATEYADHWLPSRGDEQTRAENRLVSMTLTGSRLAFKDRALEIVQAL